MNVLALNTIYSQGGAAGVMTSLCDELEKRNIDVSFGLKVGTGNYREWIDLSPNNFEKVLSRLTANDSFVYSNDILINSKEYRSSDIVHCHNLHGGYFNLKQLQQIAGVKPVVWTLHDMWAFTGHCVHSLDCQSWETGCGNCPDLKRDQPILWDNTARMWRKKKKVYDNINLTVIVPSNWLLEKVKKSILGNQMIKLIHNGVDTTIFQPYNTKEVRAEIGLPNNMKIVLFVAHGGKDNFWKGGKYLEQIIEEYKDRNDVMFVAIGGEKRKQVGNVLFLPYVKDKNTLAKYYSAVDVFLFTSIAENFPLVVLESMACGTPVVSFDVGGTKEAVLHEENGYIACYQNVNDLKQGLEYILNLEANGYGIMSQKCIRRVKENFTLNIMVRKYLDLYNKLLDSWQKK